MTQISCWSLLLANKMMVNVLKVGLVLTNFSLLAQLLVLLINHYSLHYNMFSWASIFHYLTVAWLLIRGAFWISTLFASMQWTAISFYLLYWMPTPFEFGAFMILPLYFAQILYPQEWTKYWPYCRPGYFGLIVGIAAVQLLWCGLSIIPNEIQCMSLGAVADDYDQAECFHTEVSSTIFRGITAACFFFLSAAQLVFGIKIVRIDEQRYDQYLSTSRETISVVNAVLVTSFFTRAVYQLLAVFELYILPDVPMEGDGDVPLVIFLIFEAWIYVPTYLVVALITSRFRGMPLHKEGGGYAYGAVSGSCAYADSSPSAGEEEDYFNIVPSRQSSFKHHKRRCPDSSSCSSEMIPINRTLPPEAAGDWATRLVSCSHSKSWLSEPEAQRYWKPSRAVVRERDEAASMPSAHAMMPPSSSSAHPFPSAAPSLAAYFRHQRMRSSSTNSSDGEHPLTVRFAPVPVTTVPSAVQPQPQTQQQLVQVQAQQQQQQVQSQPQQTLVQQQQPEYELLVEPASPAAGQRWSSGSIFMPTVRSYEADPLDYESTGGDHTHLQGMEAAADPQQTQGMSAGYQQGLGDTLLFYREANHSSALFHPRPTRPAPRMGVNVNLMGSPGLGSGDEDTVFNTTPNSVHRARAGARADRHAARSLQAGCEDEEEQGERDLRRVRSYQGLGGT